MTFFKQFPEFVDQDSRAVRGFSPVTIETLDSRHSASLPKWVVDGNTVLDLGSCLGATGHWVLSNGCKHYTGVEVQERLAQDSNNLLSKYWTTDQYTIAQEDIREFLDKEIAAGKKYDVVVMIGVIYAFLDTFGILKKVSELCSYTLVIDSLYPWFMTGPDIPMLDVINYQNINSSDSGSAFQGAGCRPSPKAMRVMMGALGFADKEGLIFPELLSDKTVHDSYNTPLERSNSRVHSSYNYKVPARYMLRFFNTNEFLVKQVSDYVVTNDSSKKVEMAKAPNIIINPIWSFDETVANRFQQEAETHIPDYARVIDMCLDYTKQVYGDNKSISIIDVGSALGNTMSKYFDQGYTNITGVDNSKAMIKASKYPSLVKESSQFPTDQTYDVILANWTLHFINEREQYIKDIFNSMNPGGILILSDKMDHTIETENLYYDFKRANGVTEEVIQAKKNALIGILTTKPLRWYLDTLQNLGFTDVQVVNSRFMFSTIYARK
jgi:2-polyprenyl-3-methyl-5-hydroxy-6-metoxy-1,4-benzoquinol methylase